MLKKMNSFQKTWLFSIGIILVTLLIGLGIFFLTTTVLIQKNQEQRFQQAADSLVEDIRTNGVKAAGLDRLLKQGYFISITDQANQVIYPENGSSIVVETLPEGVNDEDGNEVIGSGDAVFLTNNIVNSQDGTFLSESFEVNHNQHQLHVNVMFPVSMTPTMYWQVMKGALPLFLVVGVIVATLVSLLYARYFNHRIQIINQTMGAMATFDYQPPEETSSKDEMQVLENNLNKLYQELHGTISQLNEEVTYVQKLEQDRQLFMRGAVHELKTPIMVMQMALSEGQQGSADNAALYQEQLENMKRLVNEMLGIARLENIKFQGSQELRDVLMETIDWYQVLLEDHHLQVENLVPSDFRLNLPEKQIKKVLSNLLSNMVKYASPHSTVVFKVSETGELLSINQVPQTLSEDANKRIWEPFFTTAPKAEGSHGLGLYIVKQILARGGHSITSRSQGKEFTIVIK